MIQNVARTTVVRVAIPARMARFVWKEPVKAAVLKASRFAEAPVQALTPTACTVASAVLQEQQPVAMSASMDGTIPSIAEHVEMLAKTVKSAH